MDRLPDEVTNYTHSAPGVGRHDFPYGTLASELPSEWNELDLAPVFGEVSPDIVLKPEGVRAKGSGLRLLKGTEFLTLPRGASVTVRFDEMIVDGPGPDFSISPFLSGAESEKAEIFIGRTADDLTSIGTFTEAGQVLFFDLADFSMSGPIRFVKVAGLDLGGNSPGFDLVAMQAINTAPPAPDAHIVTVVSGSVFENLDFGSLPMTSRHLWC